MTRREMLKISLTASGILFVGCDEILWAASSKGKKNAFQGGKQVGVIEFLGEGQVEMETLVGAGLDGRLFTDLSVIAQEKLVTPTQKFYLRTRASELLEDRKPWVIKVSGLIQQPVEISRADLQKMSRQVGLHLMECSGNGRMAHFGMLSVADWAGAPVSEILDSVRIESGASRVLISGFDRYQEASFTSFPGASWIFTLDELKSSKAFLATEMNGLPLQKDHGAPVRLIVPGWYGCACIKWVDEITLLGEDAAATSQMREFATRTLQPGMPSLARDYHPAFIEQAAMPIRVEKWLVGGKIKHRVVGILWGGSRPVSDLEIQFNSDEDFVPVDNFKQTANDPWSFWTHPWTPKKPGVYFIRLRVKDILVPARRLNAGFFVRSIKIPES